jgi:hypothetical protein
MRVTLDPFWVQLTLAHTRDANATSRDARKPTCNITYKLQHSTTRRDVDFAKIMIRHDYSRVDPKRRANLDHKRRQFAKAEFQQQTYEHRLNFYVLPPTAEITLEEFETWAINRLKGESLR